MYIFDMNSRDFHHHSQNKIVHPQIFSFPIVKCQLCRDFTRKLFCSCSTFWSDCNDLASHDVGEALL